MKTGAPALFLLVWATVRLQAGGPALVPLEGTPFRWPVETPVSFTLDNGSLGDLSRDEAALRVRSAFQKWASVSTSSLRFADEGFLSIDLTAANYQAFFDNQVHPENPIVFDSDGQILEDYLGTGSSLSVYGFAGVRWAEPETHSLVSAWIVLNGRKSESSSLDWVLLHEIGHLAGLDHTQAGHDRALSADLADHRFVPAMYPLVLEGAAAELLLDDRAWVSWLYPTADFRATTGMITGRVLRADGQALSGANVVATRVTVEDRGRWSEVPGDAVAVVSGFLGTPDGSFELPGLPAGHYVVFIEPVDSRFTGISSVGLFSDPYTGFPKDYYNGDQESGFDRDDPTSFVVLGVTAGAVSGGVELITNEWVSPLIFPVSVASADLSLADTFVGVAVFNPNENSNQVELQAIDPQGSTAERVELPVELVSLGQEAFLTRDVLASVEQAASMLAEGKQGPLLGFFMIGDSQLKGIDGIGGPMLEAKRLFFPLARPEDGAVTLLFLFNAGVEDDPSVQLTLFDPEGRTVSEADRPIPALGSLIATVHQVFGVSVESGYVQVTSRVPLKGFQLHARGDSFSALTARVAVPVYQLFSPHLFVGPDQGDTELRILNPSAVSAHVELDAFDDASNLLGRAQFTIAPGALFSEPLSQLVSLAGETVQSGHFRLAITGEEGSQPALISSVTFSGNHGAFRSTLPLIEAGAFRTRFLHVAQSESIGMFTGFAILNPVAEPASITVEVFDETGQKTNARDFDLAPGHRVVDLLNGAGFFGPGFEQVKGHVEVTSSQPVIAFALFGDYDSQFLSAIEGQPAR